jgi:alkylation response protein AidB-like acyl-CoA dehydrogenase
MYLELNKNLTDQEIAIKTEVHRFAEEVLRPAAMELDQIPNPEDVIAEGSPLWSAFRKAYELGYHTIHMPEALGGADLSPLARHIVLEEMGWGAADFAVGIGVTSFPFNFAAIGGNPGLMSEHVMPRERQGSPSSAAGPSPG